MTGTLEKIVLSEITSDSAYCKAITGISVNGVDYVADWNEEDDTLVYSARLAWYDDLQRSIQRRRKYDRDQS